MKKVSSKKLCKLYQQNGGAAHRGTGTINKDLLFEIASQLDAIAQTVPTFDQDDHDWGKDAGKFHWAYVDACGGYAGPRFMGFNSPLEFLMWEIDTLLAGCHTDASQANYYLEGGEELLNAIFAWEGSGSLYEFYLSRQFSTIAYYNQ